MRIGVVSDSHSNLYMLDKAIVAMGKIDVLWHLGDHYSDIMKVNGKYNHNVDYIAGNNDYAGNVKSEKIIEIGGKRFFLCHGHKYNVNFGLMSLGYKAEEENVNVVLYGHTHAYNEEYIGKILFLNPGSVSRPRDKNASFAIINIDDNGKIYVEKMVIEY